MGREFILSGLWYDGAASKAVPARAELDRDGWLRVVKAGGDLELARQAGHEIGITARLGSTPRFLSYPDGSKFETSDNRAVDKLIHLLNQPSASGWLHRLETRWPYLLAALALTGLLVWGAVGYGLPLGARLIAHNLPPSIYSKTDAQALAVMDRTVFKPSQLPGGDTQKIRTHFKPVLEDHPGLDLKVVFRQGGRLGANAFALPGGTIIFTDEMVQLSQNDDQLAAVLAHEIGHVAHRHAMRSLIQSSALSFMILALTGDVSGTSEIFLGLPVLLTQRHYSREFERQADEYALTYMKAAGINLHHFADLMRVVEKSGDRAGDAGQGGLKDYLSSHPNMKERLKPFEN